MNDKERLQHYLSLLEGWQECLAAFFESECPTAPPGGVRVLLSGHSDITKAIARVVEELPNNQ